MKKDNILYICTEAAPGMVPFASTIINAAAISKNLNIYVLYLIDDKDVYKEAIDKTVKCYSYFISKNKIKRIISKVYPSKLVESISTICKINAIDYIHLLTVDYILAFLLKRIRKIAPVIYTVHDLYPHTSASFTLKEIFMKKYIYNLSVRNRNIADILVTNSKEQYNQLLQMYPNKNTYYHHFPSLVTNKIIEGNDLSPELIGISDYILFFGNIDRYKGVELLYKAYMNSKLYNIKYLVIAGKGTIYFKRTREKEEKVIFINRYIDNKQIKSLFKNAHCVVYPYVTITQSGVLSIAYYFQTPVIVSNVSFFLENTVDRHTGLIFPKCDVQQLTLRLNEIYDNNWNLMKEKQIKYYRQNYSLYKLTSEINSIYFK